MHAYKHESLLLVNSIIFEGFGQAFPNYSGKFAIFVWHFRKEVGNEVRDLTALTGSNTTLTTYTSNVLPPLTLFLSIYGIHAKPFLHLINCLCNISSLLFQVAVGSCELVFFSKLLVQLQNAWRNSFNWWSYYVRS